MHNRHNLKIRVFFVLSALDVLWVVSFTLRLFIPRKKKTTAFTEYKPECKTQNIVLEATVRFCDFIEYAYMVAEERVP